LENRGKWLRGERVGKRFTSELSKTKIGEEIFQKICELV